MLLRAPRARVSRALTDSERFSQWFGVTMNGPFPPGARVTGKPARSEYAHLAFEIVIERMEPETLFSWRWHPSALDPAVAYSAEPSTLVEFTLEDAPEGTILKVVESGFDGIPLTRRLQAFGGNERGWEIQIGQIRHYVEAN